MSELISTRRIVGCDRYTASQWVNVRVDGSYDWWCPAHHAFHKVAA